jgi:glutathionylspermidine synthase
MIRKKITPRPDWREKVEELGFTFHSIDDAIYWDETTCYAFTYEQVIILEQATDELYRLCIEAVEYIITNRAYDAFFIPEKFIPMIERSWNKDHPSLYGRFDLSWNGRLNEPPRLLEFNADTPTSLFEAAVVQWFWLKDFNKDADQFNSIHEKLIESWKYISPLLNNEPIHFSCLRNMPEDYINTAYLCDCAMQAGIQTLLTDISDIGYNGRYFTDRHAHPIHNIFKLYPWEWMLNEPFGKYLPHTTMLWIEPPWKMLLSNKALLPVLWKLFPSHPNLLEAYHGSPHGMKSYAEKPLFSREGANIRLVEELHNIVQTDGEYGDEGFIYQELCKLPGFDGNYPVIGSWVIGGEAAGMGIRESSSLVTDNFSRFIPHYILPK